MLLVLTDGKRCVVVSLSKAMPNEKLGCENSFDLENGHIFTVLRFTPTKMGVAKIHHNARVEKLVRVIPKMDNLNTGKGCLDTIEANNYAPENGR